MKNWNRVAIVGVGLIGGAVGQALRQRNLAKEVVGVGRSDASLKLARELGAVTDTTRDLAEGVAGADLIVVCTPVGQIVAHVREAAAACRPGTLITDAGSTKVEIVRELDKAARTDSAWQSGVRFVGSHPLAGNEKRGPQPDSAELFVDRVVIVTPTRKSQKEACATVAEFWSSLGARVIEMSPEEHDKRLAVTSHLPHLVASAIAGATPEEYVTLTAGGWLDSTRIAAGDPELWRQIMLGNRGNLLRALGQFRKTLKTFGDALRKGDAEQLEQLLAEAKRIRDAVGS